MGSRSASFLSTSEAREGARLWRRTRRYGRAFLQSLPPCSVRQGPAGEAGRVARAWIERTGAPTRRYWRSPGNMNGATGHWSAILSWA